MAEPIEMLFGLWTRVGHTNHVLDGVQIPRVNGVILKGKGCSVVSCGDCCPCMVAMRPFCKITLTTCFLWL